MSDHPFTAPIASRFATIALAHLTREYPNKLTHGLAGPQDVRSPRELHPVFYGSYDWHSCVHGYWLIARVLQRFPDLPEAPRIVATFDEHFTDEKMAGERAYLDLPHNQGFERPYGWAWLLALAAQLDAMNTPEAQRWSRALAPLTGTFVERFETFLPKATYPLRVGTHFNTAFALTLALDFARQTGRAGLATLIEDTARRWHLNDVACQAWEPSGDEFLSPALMEAVLMSRVLPRDAFHAWFAAFLPELAARRPATLFTPATVTDRSDGKIAHLDGLNLSRAWCQRTLARALPDGDARIALLHEAARTHLDTALPHVAGDYMGEHWLATFATLALDA
ncbi:DUF2891 domain-containing protein [Paraburkholderia caballeronis]|uniref:DUF2891 domain-containing protein n=1 Tax=Paraburkholderia caballeronis TaxID=416943 RepID=A0A1H7QHP2_9BURK|nr:DUF2891 domain-containing protein [Paraburkholderia caballeronis]PXW22565.1 hypothetical protein C7403_114141 [Paraburkholderia caballeronis]PXW96436.1 hypothetical protein C7407_114141 [Paraburkholderia caballeronis]RAJ92847.1 hypothetical protein C7409_114141 [Paraburkholderia caballeronis]TDV34366.1 hypothetical protein C7405_10897 [Paraburkholderia caballeronis]SEE06810.1 Protein of unknown function [Paraburkholderia caballeronis]